MISVDSRDGRKRIGLGLEMAETELEEGEALGYQEEGEDSTIDPDISLSYIEEKVHRFLGHLQKDFEGGVSAENLGAKFGGYGSFLPTYQRSPSWSQTRLPAESHNYDSLRSPKKPHTEDQRQNSLASSSASGKAASVGSSLKGNGYLKSKHGEESSLKGGIDKKSSNDQRTLKVRIKVGADNMSAQKNVDIYSGLGLVVSPSSSMDDSPVTSEGQYGKLSDMPEESPTSILQIMTSYSNELLLSPLSDDLIRLTEKRKSRGKHETKPVDKTRKNSGSLVNGSLSSRSNPKVTEQIKLTSSEKGDDFFAELSHQKNNACMDNNVSPVKREKETDADPFGYDELVSKALKLPLLASSQHMVSDSSKDTSDRIATKDGMKRESFSPFVKKEHLENISESKEGNLVDEKPYASDQSESNASRGIKAFNASEPTEPSKQLVDKKGGSVNSDVLESSLDKSSTGSKRKLKETQNRGSECAYMVKDELMVESSPALKSGKTSHTNRYKDFFGDVEFEDDDNESVSGKENLSKDRNVSRENHTSRIPERTPEKYARPASHSAPPVENGPISEAPVGTIPLVQEDWVLCDKCKKWRLLPLGTNPKSLPDKWLCRMLTWLPGMNHCRIPEEETTNALRALYHPVAPVNGQDNRPYNSVVASAGMTPADSTQVAHEHQAVAVPTATIIGKKKVDVDGPTNSSNSRKKNVGVLGKVSNSNSMNNSPSVDVSGQHMQQAEKVSHIISSDKGTNVRAKSKRDSDMDGSRASKRMKSEELHVDDENWTSDIGGASSKSARRASSLSNNTSVLPKSILSSMNAEVHVPSPSGNGLLVSVKCDDEDSRTRREKEIHGSKIHTEPISTGDFVEQLSESEHRKEKKARHSKSGGKTSVAATSSSSKVSGSHRTKTNGFEIKGSPVESVSSSPLRFPNSDKITSARKILDGRNDFLDSTSANPASLLGCNKKDAALTVNDRIDDDQLGQSKPSKVEVKANYDQSQRVHTKKSGKSSSSHSKDKARTDIEKIKIKASDSRNDASDHTHLHDEKSKSRRNKSDEKSSIPNKFATKKETAGGTSIDSDKRPTQKQDLPNERETEKLPKKSNNGKSHSLPPLARIQTDTTPLSTSHKESSSKTPAVDAFDNGDALKISNKSKKSEKSNSQPMRHPTPNSHNAPSPARRDSTSHAANSILKEAKDLKHMADRLKSSGTSIGLYFEAALKFLHGASLLESGSSEATKHNEFMHAMHIYSSTAKLCEFCAHEYEKSKDMGAAALAYKCVEVAYMRVVYSSHGSASRDRNELQTALQIVAPGESPSSSASDVDNLTHQATADKAASSKVVGSPQVSGSQIFTSHNRSGLRRVLTFAQDVTSAMEASRKSRIAFTAATSLLGETSHREGIDSLRKALDYNFQDVEGLLQLVRIAMEAIGR